MGTELIPPSSRVLVIAAHPDDETIGAAGLLHDLQIRGDVELAVAHVTEGTSRSGAGAAGFSNEAAYARARRGEVRAAFADLPGEPPDWFCLGLPDQHVARHLVDAVAEIRALLNIVEPDVVITHSYEGGHPDHDATAFATFAALRYRRRPRTVEQLEMTSYHWTGGASLECGNFRESAEPVSVLQLTGATARVKHRMLSRFVTQRAVLESLRLPPCERFRRAPRYDFRSPPCALEHLWYDRVCPEFRGASWCALAAEAIDALKLQRTVRYPPQGESDGEYRPQPGRH